MPALRRSPAPTGPLARLSRRAVEYGAALALDDVRELAARLYRYNSLPATAAWRHRVPDERAAVRLLALDRGAGGRGRRAELGDGGHRSAIWQVWSAEDVAMPEGAVFKLYVSPRPLETGDACRVLRAQLGRRDGPFSVKVAVDPASLLRPDRLVGYFTSNAACLATARRLAPALTRLTPQGVPFTVAIGSSPLLSWAADPPAAIAESLPKSERSWRGWVTARVAEALAGGRIETAFERLRALGIDPVRWVPAW